MKKFLFIVISLLFLPDVFAASDLSKKIYDREILRAVSRQLVVNPATALARRAFFVLFKEDPHSPTFERDLYRLENEFKYIQRLRDEKIVLDFLDQAVSAGKLKADKRLPELRKKLAEALVLLESDKWDQARPLVSEVLEGMDGKVVPDFIKQAPEHFFGTGDLVLRHVKTRLAAAGLTVTPPEVFEKIGLKRREDVFWGYRPFSAIRFLVVHHTVEDKLKDIFKRHTQAGHFDEKGGPFISYHFLILEDGAIISLNHLEDKVWHAREANFNGVGIALIGNRDEKPAPPAQAKALKGLVRVLTEELKLKPQSVYGHGELVGYGNDSVCPGKFGRQIYK